MREPLPILVAMACLLSSVAAAESISFQHHPALVSKGHSARTIARTGARVHAIAGDLGRGFSNTELTARLKSWGRERDDDNRPRGLFPSGNHQLNFGFYPNSQPPSTGMDAVTDYVMGAFVERKPRGARGRRELAEANSR